MRQRLTRREAVRLTTAVTALTIVAHLAPADQPPSRLPNFVILFADDMGYGDLGCFGHPTIRTPRLDRMAAEGTRLTQFYSAASLCTPSRAALLTGRYPIRSRMTRVLYPDDLTGLPQEEITLAEALKIEGYATACIGKWHLGSHPKDRPTRHGFDRYFGLLHSNDMEPVILYRNGEQVEHPVNQATLTERYTTEALRFITQMKDQPFFCYVPYTMPHTPLHVSERFAGRSSRGLYGDVVETIDWSVGEILDRLRALGLEEQTLVIFTSDNGHEKYAGLEGGSGGLLRGGKGTTWEGGVRVPFIARWPGRIPPRQVSQEVGTTMDLFTTCLTLADAPLPGDRTIDGLDLMPVLEGTGPSKHGPLFFFQSDYVTAIRRGRWKMHIVTESPYPRPQTPPLRATPLLFDLLRDPAETADVADEHPKIVASLKEEIERFLLTVNPR